MSQTYVDDCYGSAHTATTDLQAFENNFAALKSAFSGATEPANTVAGMWWYDTTANILKLRNEANNAWQGVWDFANNKPVIANLSNEITGAMISSAIKDAAAATPSLRTLGTGAAQACPGNDARLSNARVAAGGNADYATSSGSAGNSDTVDGFHFRGTTGSVYTPPTGYLSGFTTHYYYFQVYANGDWRTIYSYATGVTY
jgi:hypothetical protein